MNFAMMTDIDYMRIAYKLARRAQGETSPNPLVGAVIVHQGKIVGEGWHKSCGGDHAEIVALKKAKDKSRGATLYVTLEPCGHFGRTPPCVDQIIQGGIHEVIVGMKDPNPLTNGQSLVKLRHAGIKVKVGFLKEELSRMNEAFIKYITQRLPFVVAKSAQTLDGKIASARGDSRWITSPESRAYAHTLRKDFDGILVGINTVLKDNPFLNAPEKKFKPIKKIIVDSTLRVPLDANIFKASQPLDIIIATTPKAKKARIHLLRQKGIEILICPQQRGKVRLKWLLKELARREIASLLIEGGGRIIGSALREKLVDKFLVFMAPKIMGDETALPSVMGLKTANVHEALRLHRIKVKRISDDILIEAYVHRDH